jgi:hypothetical protein
MVGVQSFTAATVEMVIIACGGLVDIEDGDR